MNYRHAYHAGNFADVLKHATLALIVEHLKRKPTPFRVIDTHAGPGLYDLTGIQAEKTGEWKQGIAHLYGPEAGRLPQDIAPLLAAYLSAVAQQNPAGGLARYPGSPCLARSLLRPEDRLVVNELHPEDATELKSLFTRDRQTTVLHLDGWTALKSLLPPKEKRGVILIDPPFEQPGELDRLVDGLREAVSRFATGIYMLWYPIKNPKMIATFHSALTIGGYPKLLVAELMLRAPHDIDRLNGTGIAILNPPWQLDDQLNKLLPFLSSRMGENDASHRLFWLGVKAA